MNLHLGPEFIEFCIERDFLTATEVHFIRQQSAVVDDLAGLIVSNGFMTACDLLERFSIFSGIPFLHSLPKIDSSKEVLARIPLDLQRSLNFLVTGIERGKVHIVCSHTNLSRISEVLFRRTGMVADFSVVSPELLRAYLQQTLFDPLTQFQGLIANTPESQLPSKLEAIFLALLESAVIMRATDVHIVAKDQLIHVLFRIDGVLQPFFALSPSLSRMVNYIKVQAEMDIAEQRLPQDGSFTLILTGAPFTIRVSTIPTRYGERVALRLLSESSETPDLNAIGYAETDAAILQVVANEPSGLIVVTGPTGSGKSTTLHAMLKMSDQIGRNVLTVEDPIEYLLPMAGQTEVNKRAGYDFQRALRHFLRHDPDVILLGEMRDSETAKAAIDAATTGHLVLSTLHVTTAMGVPNRLVSMGLNPLALGENLKCVIAQRLLRKLCSLCGNGTQRLQCSHCQGTGYRGRIPTYEIVLVTQEIRSAIQCGASADQLRSILDGQNSKSMRQHAMELVSKHLTDIPEVERVLGAV